MGLFYEAASTSPPLWLIRAGHGTARLRLMQWEHSGMSVISEKGCRRAVCWNQEGSIGSLTGTGGSLAYPIHPYSSGPHTRVFPYKKEHTDSFSDWSQARCFSCPPNSYPQVSLWYTDHSTANPLGVRPDPRVTKVVRGDKFGMEGVEVVKEGQLERWKNRIRKGLRQ